LIVTRVIITFPSKKRTKSRKSRDERLISDLAETFNNLRKFKMKLNPEKCTFGVSSRKLLRYMVSVGIKQPEAAWPRTRRGQKCEGIGQLRMEVIETKASRALRDSNKCLIHLPGGIPRGSIYRSG
jgi:hypothetical protein